MKILLSAYACSPYYGSEQGIGWNFAEQLALQGHEVIVITHEAKAAVEKKYSKERYPNLTFIYYSLPEKLKKIIFRGTGPLAHIYYFLWQVSSFFFLKKFIRNKEIDVIHHVTLGVFRTPVFLGFLGKPFVFGPVGGGETCPAALQEKLPIKFKLKETLRHWANLSVLWNPLAWLCFQSSNLILLKTSDNLRYIPKRFHYKCQVSLEVGISEDLLQGNVSPKKYNSDFKILFAGRLEYWKGGHLAIKCFSRLLKSFPSVEFLMVGSGNDEEWIKDMARQEGVFEKIQWIPRVEQAVLFKMYRNNDLLLFPSLHDSSGGVVLESLTFGLPVVCLDLGGPKEIVDESCSWVVSTEGRSEKQVVDALAEVITELFYSPEKMEIMSKNAQLKAQEYVWEKVVARIYSDIEEKVLNYHLIS